MLDAIGNCEVYCLSCDYDIKSVIGDKVQRSCVVYRQDIE
ncbi:MAG: hypothetical protein RJB34_584 [Pseudomonadota bacterium]|jgi:hypothetical protein